MAKAAVDLFIDIAALAAIDDMAKREGNGRNAVIRRLLYDAIRRAGYQLDLDAPQARPAAPESTISGS